MIRKHHLLLASAATLAMLAACEHASDPVPGEAPEVAEAVAPPPPPPPPPPPAPPPPPPGLESVVVTGNQRAAADMAGAMPSPVMAPPPMAQTAPQPIPGDVDTERYEDVEINPVKLVSEEPVSTFSIDVDTASYGVVRSYLNDGVLPPKDAVRIEELINYFDYTYLMPEGPENPFSMNVNIAPSPWAEGRELMQVGIQGYDIEPDERPPLNLTLLVDVSGSMGQANKLPLAKKALALLIDQMTDQDSISIAVYAGAAGQVLEPTLATEANKGKILASFENLGAGGSTAGGEGLRLAYALAEQNFQEDGVNRVMLLTDGDFNVGINDPERLEDFVSRKRETGIYLSVMGFGRGNYNDALMQKIAQTGNGTAAYVDTLNEARKLLNDDLTSNLFPIADDVKIQVEFNPDVVAEYRLIGYETRMLNREDFNNDAVDAGDIGAGASVTAIYEITRTDSDARLIDDSRYNPSPDPASEARANEYAFLKLRQKAPGAEESELVTRPITVADRHDSIEASPQWAQFATAVAGYGQLLRGDPYTASDWGFDQVIKLAQASKGPDEFGYRAEFINLARLANTAAAQARLEPEGSDGPY
ncbi:MAG: VWA domain-containing protein [Hyphomonadaceae bacterium]|nr:VWA domain-containing protein [Hyphomonadaceae bacterium]